MVEEGSAPYEMGAVVNFECLEGAGIVRYFIIILLLLYIYFSAIL